uniref:Uncharacterized LOC107078435 n=1 Tax=Lepisosteus oculatus TaxID=7918 RepID=W5N4G8_LEPOC|nr:PREDICTED: uncharacterized protein LOC107078435 [Lepisosteus oculatus]
MSVQLKTYNGGQKCEEWLLCKQTETCKPEVQKCIKDFLQLKKSKLDLHELSKLVKRHTGLRVPLKCPEGFCLRITGQDGTIYWGRKDMMESWQELYLPKSEKMVVIGAVDNYPCLAEGQQLVVMVDSRGNVYAYENHELHLMAHSVESVFRSRGVGPFPIQSYKYGEHTAPETEEEYLQILKDQAIPKINTYTLEFVESKEKDFSEIMDFLMDL